MASQSYTKITVEACIGYKVNMGDGEFKSMDDAITYVQQVNCVIGGKIDDWGMTLIQSDLLDEFIIIVHHLDTCQSFEDQIDSKDANFYSGLILPEKENKKQTQRVLKLFEDFLGVSIDNTPTLFLSMSKS